MVAAVAVHKGGDTSLTFSPFLLSSLPLPPPAPHVWLAGWLLPCSRSVLSALHFLVRVTFTGSAPHSFYRSPLPLFVFCLHSVHRVRLAIALRLELEVDFFFYIPHRLEGENFLFSWGVFLSKKSLANKLFCATRRWHCESCAQLYGTQPNLQLILLAVTVNNSVLNKMHKNIWFHLGLGRTSSFKVFFFFSRIKAFITHSQLFQKNQRLIGIYF